jgi:hypothetical protein
MACFEYQSEEDSVCAFEVLKIGAALKIESKKKVASQ